MKLTPKQLHHLINVHGLRTPRLKQDKVMDQTLYDQGFKRSGAVLKAIYEIVKETI
jgi:hypothetical protein